MHDTSASVASAAYKGSSAPPIPSADPAILLENLKCEYVHWKQSGANLPALLSAYYSLGYSLRPSFDPDIDFTIESLYLACAPCSCDLFSVAQRYESTVVLEHVANDLSETLLSDMVSRIACSRDIIRIAESAGYNIFEFSWRAATFSNAYSLKRVHYGGTSSFVGGITHDCAVCVLHGADSGYLLSQSAGSVTIKKLDTEDYFSAVDNIKGIPRITIE